MVLPPQYEEMRRARVQEVPLAFKEVLSKAGVLADYVLKVLNPPEHPPGWTGPMQRPSFEIKRKGAKGAAVARILPGGETELLEEGFAPLLDEIMEQANLAGKKAYDEWLAEYARLKAVQQ
ncbi:MAG: hypothetical protein ACM3L5_00260 [Candidatus Saccharibacteria bacterium]